MRAFVLLAVTLALPACNKAAEAPVNDIALNADANLSLDNLTDANMANANMADGNAAAPMALTSINSTTWEFTDAKSGKPMQESVDASGKYITVSGKEHIDHGTAVMKNGKACFTSAMDKEGEVCWTDPMVGVGQSGVTTSDKGEKLTVKRTEYVPLTM